MQPERLAVPHNEHERTLAFAQIALDQIRALGQPASPRNFAIWYHYATGYNPALNRAINQTLEQKGALADPDLEQIYDTYIATERVGQAVDSVGSKVLDEIKQVLAMIDAASGTTTSYSESLADASAKLAATSDRDTLRAVIERLIEGTRDMEINNKKLEASLSTSRQEIEQLHESLATVRTESQTDPLTGLANRKMFDGAVAKAIADAKEKREALALLMADVDYFKLFNDKFGHQTGDQVLRLVAQAMKQNVKGQDIAARYGGEEFVIALPRTALRAAVSVAEQIRSAVMAKELMKRSNGERLGRITISIGVAHLRGDDAASSLIERADHCLYAAKRNGRNRVICETDPEATSGSDSPAPARVA